MMASTYVPIASFTLASSAASVTFSAIPQTFTDLLVRITARSDADNPSFTFITRINGSSAANYSSTHLRGSGTAASSFRASNGTEWEILNGTGSSVLATSNTFGSSELYIPNYAATIYKVSSAFTVNENNSATAGYANIYANAALRSVTDAVTSLSLAFAFSANFVAGSTFHLYGIKNS